MDIKELLRNLANQSLRLIMWDVERESSPFVPFSLRKAHKSLACRENFVREEKGNYHVLTDHNANASYQLMINSLEFLSFASSV